MSQEKETLFDTENRKSSPKRSKVTLIHGPVVEMHLIYCQLAVQYKNTHAS